MAQASLSGKTQGFDGSVHECIERASKYVGIAKAERTNRHLCEVFADGTIESPIEQMVICGLMAVSAHSQFMFFAEYDSKLCKDLHFSHRPIGAVFCYPQMSISKYRADFVIHAVTGEKDCPLVLELDGHQWHERSEQDRRKEKRRDRYMQSLGFRLARYTGSEAYGDPFEVAREALDLSAGSAGLFFNPHRPGAD